MKIIIISVRPGLTNASPYREHIVTFKNVEHWEFYEGFVVIKRSGGLPDKLVNCDSILDMEVE